MECASVADMRTANLFLRRKKQQIGFFLTPKQCAKPGTTHAERGAHAISMSRAERQFYRTRALVFAVARQNEILSQPTRIK